MSIIGRITPEMASLRRSDYSKKSDSGGWFTRNHRQKTRSPRSHFLLTTASQRTRFPPSFPPPTPIPLPNPLAHIRQSTLVRLFPAPSPAKTRTSPRTVLYKLSNSTPHHSSHYTKIPSIPNFVHSAQLFHYKHIQNYYVASP